MLISKEEADEVEPRQRAGPRVGEEVGMCQGAVPWLVWPRGTGVSGSRYKGARPLMAGQRHQL